MNKQGSNGPSTNGSNGRDDRGRFRPGNAGGPGNPHAAAVGKWRAALASSVTPEDLQEVIRAMVDQAKAGEAWAVRELLNRCLGRPAQTVAVEGSDGIWREMVADLEAAQFPPEGEPDEED